MSEDDINKWFDPSAGSNSEHSKKPQMASTELPGKGEFFLYHQLSHDSTYGSGGGVWLIGSEAEEKLAKDGLDGVLEDPKFKSSAALFIVAQGKTGKHPGLLIDYYNNPAFRDYDGLRLPPGRGKGVIDILAVTDKRDPLFGAVTELHGSVLMARANEIHQESPNLESISVQNIFFHEVANPEKVIERLFNRYDYQIVPKEDDSHTTSIEVILPLDQFTGEL